MWCPKSRGDGAHSLPCTSNSDVSDVSQQRVRKLKKSVQKIDFQFFFARGVKLRNGRGKISINVFLV